MPLNYVATHLFFATFLFAAVFADVFFLRAPSSLAMHPTQLAAQWRKRVALLEMVIFLIVVAIGLTVWIPGRQAYNPAIFHSKMGLAVVFLVLGKIRMFKEKRSGAPAIGLTRLMGIVTLIVFLLGMASAFHL